MHVTIRAINPQVIGIQAEIVIINLKLYSGLLYFIPQHFYDILLCKVAKTLKKLTRHAILVLIFATDYYSISTINPKSN